jgi:hypothetical protein
MNNKSDRQQPTTTTDLNVWARRIFLALTSENFNATKAEAIGDILSNLVTESGIAADHSQLIEIAYPVMIQALPFEYGRGIHHAIKSIIHSEVLDNETLESEFDYDDKKKSGAAKTEADARQAAYEEKDLAITLSRVIAGEYGELPKPLYDAIMKALDHTGDTFEQYYSGSKIGSADYIHEYLQSYSDEDDALEMVNTAEGEKLALVIDGLLDNKNLPSEVHNAITHSFVAMMSGKDERSLNAEVLTELLTTTQTAKRKTTKGGKKTAKTK